MKHFFLLLTLLLSYTAATQPKQPNYEQQIVRLEKRFDSLSKANVVLENKVKILNDTLRANKDQYKDLEEYELIGKVHEFYESAWLKMLLFGGLIGVIVPYYFNWHQQRDLKNLLAESRVTLQNDYSSLISNLDKKIVEKDKIISKIEANMHVISSELFEKDGFYVDAAASVLSAIILVKDTWDDQDDALIYNLEVMLRNLNKLKKSDFEEFEMLIQKYTALSSEEIIVELGKHKMISRVKKLVEQIQTKYRTITN